MIGQPLRTGAAEKEEPMKQNWLRTGTVAVALSLATVAAYAQATSGQTPRSAGSHDSQTSDTQSKQFVQKMLMANMAEVQLGQLAVEHGTSPEVKSFAQMLVTDHTKANQD